MRAAYALLLLSVPAVAVTFPIRLTVPPRQELDVLPDGRVHVLSNTGQALETQFELSGVKYVLANCDLTAGHYIDTICDLVAAPSGISQSKAQ